MVISLLDIKNCKIMLTKGLKKTYKHNIYVVGGIAATHIFMETPTGLEVEVIE